MNMIEFTVEDTLAYRLRVTKQECLRPGRLFKVCFIREIKDEDGAVESSSEYEFFLTQDQLNNLAKGLIET